MHHTRRTPIVALAAAAVTAALGAAAAAQDSGPEPIDRDLAAERPTPVTFDGEDRSQQIQLQLVAEAGALVGVELVRTDRSPVPAPQVLSRIGGDWIVRVDADVPYQFLAISPLWREAEEPHDDETRSPDGSESEDDHGYEWVAQNGAVEWILNLPLQVNGERVGDISAVAVFDALTEEELFAVEL